MENDPRFEFRSARDILADLLLNAQATTYPLTDQPVLPEQTTVLYDNPAVISIAFSQPDVSYVVYDDTNTKMSEVATGNGGELKLQTGHLTKQDYTFTVIATKTFSNNTRQLLQTATVKVGANLNLPVTPAKEYFDYNTPVTVMVSGAQSGAIYQLLNTNDQPLSEGLNSANGGELSITTANPVTEDVKIKVRVTNIKTGLTGILDTQPVIKLAPNTGLKATLKDSVTDYNGTAAIMLEGTQESTTYQLQFEDIDDDNPEKQLPAKTIISKAVKGNRGTIKLPVKFAVQEDLTASILATKTETGIAKELEAKITIPVRPDPNKTLSVVEETVDPTIGATIKVAQTQRGILYQLRSDPDNTSIGRPEYHHKNKGIGNARLEVEFTLGEFTADSVYLPTGPLQKTTTFNVLAIKATTRQTALAGTITVAIKETT